MSDNIKKTIICPNCSLTPIITLEDSNFNLKCLLNHQHKSESIDNFLSDKAIEENYICPEHKINNYFCFCKKCNKNICIRCFEYHEEHENDLVFFHKIIPKQKEYDEYEYQLKDMEKNEKILKDLYSKIKNLKEKINELNNLINKAYDELNIYYKNYHNQFLFNKIIFESYNINKLNYNSILNIKKFNFNKNKTNEFIKLLNIKQLDELIIDIIFLSNISLQIPFSLELLKKLEERKEYYEIKALFKIYHEMLIKKINDNNSLIFETNGEEIEIFDKSSDTKKMIKINIVFKEEKENKIIGEIKYNKDKKEVTFSLINEEIIENKRDSLLGLILLITFFPFLIKFLKKKYIIKSKGKILSYFFKENKEFFLVDENVESLFGIEEIDLDYNINNLENYLQYIISDISLEEFKEIYCQMEKEFERKVLNKELIEVKKIKDISEIELSEDEDNHKIELDEK